MALAKAYFWTALALVLSIADSSDEILGNLESFLPDSESSLLKRRGEFESWESTKSIRTMDDVPLVVAVAKTLSSMSRYLARDAENMRKALDDVLFCVRLSKGQLMQLQADAPQLYAGGELTQLLEGAEQDLDEAARVLEANFHLSPNFLMEFSFSRIPALAEKIPQLSSESTIPGFETVWQQAYEYNLQQSGSVTEFGLQASDRCMSQLQPEPLPAEAQPLEGRSSYCPVDDACWLMTTKPGAEGYYLTHQLLFLLLGENGGCAPDFEKHVVRYFGPQLPAEAGEVTEELMRRLCRDVLRDANIIADLDYPLATLDLFLEQGFLCGAAFNMPQFFQENWIRTAMSWQKSSGCYGVPIPTARSSRIADYSEGRGGSEGNSTESYERSGAGIGVYGADGDNPAPEPRVEEYMAQECYAHFTAVALGYFTVAMRYLADTWI